MHTQRITTKLAIKFLLVLFINLLACTGSEQQTQGIGSTLSRDVIQATEPNEGTQQQETTFWNERPPGLPDCQGDFKFTHHLIDPKNVSQIMFGPGSHIAPHEHMAYWGLWGPENKGVDLFNPDANPTPVTNISSEKPLHVSYQVQLFAPIDIYRIDVREGSRLTPDGTEYIEWGGYLYTCNGHQLMLGHIGDPSDELKKILADTKPECGTFSARGGEKECIWVTDTLIPSGTPIFKNSGYTGALDFGLSLAGLTDKQLQEQYGYGYSITPWRSGAKTAVCPLEYFIEPIKSEYLELLRDFRCGPFNQDVPGTAMGYWLPSPSPKSPPLMAHWKGDDEWETIWLFQSFIDNTEYAITVGNNTFGLDYNEAQYYFTAVTDGVVNRGWDSIKTGQNYCSELKKGSNMYERDTQIHKILILSLSEDATELTIEAIDKDACGTGPWKFQGNARIFYR